MRAALAVLLLASLLAACAAPEPPAEGDAPADDGSEDGRVSRGGDGDADAEGEEGDGRNVTTLAERQGGNAGPERIPLLVTVPDGGATAVEWMLRGEPAVLPAGDGVEGPGCTWTNWGGSGTYHRFLGTCDDLSPGQHGFTIVLQEPVLAYHATVTGRVEVAGAAEPAPAAARATET